MKASDVRVGDRLLKDGYCTEIYKVIEVLPAEPDDVTVKVRVRYWVDGGDDIRTWFADDDVPLTPAVRDA